MINKYLTFNFLPEKMKPLVDNLDDVYSKTEEKLKVFALSLKALRNFLPHCCGFFILGRK